jgi:hypothetical protein
LELQLKLGTDRRLQRQFLLARKDRFLLVADVLLGDRSQRIEYCHAIPVTEDVKFQPARETREGHLVGKRRLARVMPLALPEWRSARSPGSLEATNDILQLRMETQGRRLYAPLFFDLDANRIRRLATWRQLTVAEHLEIQPADEAVGYRVQVARQQWLFYRSLGSQGNRTLLGHNLASEFLAARLGFKGQVDNVVEIE